VACGIALLGLATTSQGAISGTKHDFSTETWNTSQEVCNVCHAPHNTGGNTIAPAWNHETTAASFTVYSSPSLQATVGQPQGNSLACLSCHDGTVAIDSFGGDTGSVMITGDANVGTDLANDHPVSFVYDSTLAAADGGLLSPAGDDRVDAGGLLRLFNTRMECATCHDPHDNTHGYFLAVDNTGSAMCMTCHQK